MLFFADNNCHFVQFDLVIEAEPGALPRALAPFARQNVVPSRIKTKAHGSVIEATITLNEIDYDSVRLIEANLRRMIGLRRLVIMQGRVQKKPPDIKPLKPAGFSGELLAWVIRYFKKTQQRDAAHRLIQVLIFPPQLA